MGTTDWDIEINGTGHFLYPTNEYRYSRDAISVQRDQIDTSSEPGEQSLTSWWYRSQSSFHLGMGQEWFDTVRGNDTDQYRFDDAYGMNPWTKGEVVLQPQALRSGELNYQDSTLGKPAQFSTSDNRSGIVYPYDNTIYKMYWNKSTAVVEGEVVQASLAHEKLNMTGGATTVNQVLDVCTMGNFAWFWCLTDGNKKIEIRRTNIIDGSGTKTYWHANLSDLSVGTSANDNYRTARLSFRNSVLAATYGRYWWSMPNPETVTVPETLNKTVEPAENTLNRLLFKHPDPDYCFLDVARTNGPIAACGTQVKGDSIIFGNRSQVWACLPSDEQTSETKDILEMDPPFVSAETPAGEQIFRMDVSMNFIFLGTTIGLRVAEMDTKGDILIGPPHESDGPVFDCANFGQFVWFTGSNSGGVYRLDLRNAINRQSYTFAYARDGELGSHDPLYNIAQQGGMPKRGTAAVHVEMFGNSGGPVWYYAGATDAADKGRYYATWEFDRDPVTGQPGTVQTKRQDYGWIRTPRIRMDTWEFKLFQYLRTLWDPQRVDADGEGSIRPSWIETKGGQPENLLQGESWHTCDDQGYVDTPGSYPNGERKPLLDVGYHFMLWDQPNSSTGTEKDPAFKGYQAKAKPTNIADKELQLPLLCARRERMRQGRTVERGTWERVKEMEKLQRTGEIVDYKNLGTGEEGKVIVDSCQFVSTYVPQSKQEQEDRLGILLVKLRIVESADYKSGITKTSLPPW